MKKDFNDFLSTLDQNTFEEITKKANSQVSGTKLSLDQEGMTKFMTAIGIVDITFTLELLKLYHDWLND